MNVNEYFGTLLQSVTETHKKHLMVGKYSDHKALNEFYDEMPELVDALVEHYQGEHGKVENYKNMIEAEGKDAKTYLEELLDFTKKGRDELFKDDSALSSDIDSIIGQIDSTLYQLRELKENRGIIPLYPYLKNYILMESFQSDILRTLYLSLKPRAREGRSYYYDGDRPMWDKIKDSDLTKLTKDEALKRMRSRKEPGYLIWFLNNGTSCGGVTWGCDVIITFDGYYKGVTANSVAYDCDGAYELNNPTNFIRTDLQKARREAREGALALKNFDKVKAENLERYEKALAKLHNPGTENVTKLFTETMEIYKNLVDKYVAKFVSIMQEGNGSFYSIQREWELLNKIIVRMTEDVHMYNYNDKMSSDKSAMYYYKKVSEAAKQIEEMVNAFEANSK